MSHFWCYTRGNAGITLTIVIERVVFFLRINKKRATIMALIIVVIILLLLLKCCTKDKGIKEPDDSVKIAEAIKDIRGLMLNNIEDLENLLSRADLCSEEWFEDLDRFIMDLEEQLTLMINKNDGNYDKVITAQRNLITALKSFRDQQTKETTDELEKVFNEYRAIYNSYQ